MQLIFVSFWTALDHLFSIRWLSANSHLVDLCLKMRRFVRCVRQFRSAFQHGRSSFHSDLSGKQQVSINWKTGGVSKPLHNAEIARYLLPLSIVTRNLVTDSAKVANGGWLLIPILLSFSVLVCIWFHRFGYALE